MDSPLIDQIRQLKTQISSCPAGTERYYKLFDQLVELETYRAYLRIETQLNKTKPTTEGE